MTTEEKSKLAKESTFLCMIHKYKCDKQEIYLMVGDNNPATSRESEFKSLYEKFYQLITDVLQ